MNAALPGTEVQREAPLRLLDRIVAHGPEAAAFLHAQLASDVKALASGAWQWSAWLNPQGRAVAVLLLLRLGDDTFELLVPAARGADLMAQLQRFVFRAKVKFTLQGQAVPGEDMQALAAEAPNGGTINTDAQHPWLAPVRGTRIVLASPTEHLALDETRWRECLTRDGIALLGAATAGQFTAHALDLLARDAASVSKGCYPGQEIVARTHFRGRSKRVLCRFTLASAQLPEAGTALQRAGVAVADVVLAYAAPGGMAGLAVAHEDAALATQSDDVLRLEPVR